MSIASEITRLQGVKTDILQAIANKGVTVPAGSALDDCPSLIGNIEQGGKYKIGDKYYSTAKIGGNIWILENLDFVWEGLEVGGASATTNPQAHYYDNDENTYGWNGRKCGLLYNWYAVKYLNDNKSTLIPGWHPATKSEWDALSSTIINAGTSSKSVDSDWFSGWGGTDLFGFSASPCGDWTHIDGFINIGTRGRYWTSDSYDTDLAYRKYLAPAIVTIEEDYTSKLCGESLRLVKD